MVTIVNRKAESFVSLLARDFGLTPEEVRRRLRKAPKAEKGPNPWSLVWPVPGGVLISDRLWALFEGQEVELHLLSTSVPLFGMVTHHDLKFLVLETPSSETVRVAKSAVMEIRLISQRTRGTSGAAAEMAS